MTPCFRGKSAPYQKGMHVNATLTNRVWLSNNMSLQY